MARGPYYTKEEDALLMSLYEDNSEKKYIVLAKMAQRYGICTERNTEALAQHISALVSVGDDIDEMTDDEEERIETVIIMNALEKSRDEYRTKYEDLLSTVLNTSTLADSGIMYLSFKDIRNWLLKNEPSKMAARIEELEMKAKNKEANL